MVSFDLSGEGVAYIFEVGLGKVVLVAVKLEPVLGGLFWDRKICRRMACWLLGWQIQLGFIFVGAFSAVLLGPTLLVNLYIHYFLA